MVAASSLFKTLLIIPFYNEENNVQNLVDEILVNDEPAVAGIDDGTTTGSCPENNCDIIALMYGDVCVGWSYCTVSNGDVTIAANLNDFVTPILSDYPSPPNSILTANFFDASEGIVFYGVAGNLGPIFNFGSILEDQYNITGDGSFAGNPSGCPISYADNFDPNAGSGDVDLCEFSVTGCTDSNACNYNDDVTHDLLCIDCMMDCDDEAMNYIAEWMISCNLCLQNNDCSGFINDSDECGLSASLG